MYSLRVNTITNAQRAIRLLKSRGINSKIGRLKNPSKSGGCGYTVDLEIEDIGRVEEYLKSNGIRVFGIDEA